MYAEEYFILYDRAMEEIDAGELNMLETIGDGSTSIVYVASYNGSRVAVKELRFGKAELSNAQRQAIQRELSVLAQAKHRSILQCFGLVTEWPLRLVLEYCEGGSLFELLHNCKSVTLSSAQRLTALVDTADAMRYLHSFSPPIMHRDLKSLNIMLLAPVTHELTPVQVRLADFGFARSWTDVGMTPAVGTKHWMAPEVFLQAEYTEKADVFSFAMVLYEVVCRSVPFQMVAPDVAARFLSVGDRPLFEEYVSLDEVPEGLTDVASQCWSSNPVERPSFDKIYPKLVSIRAEAGEVVSVSL